MIPIRDENRVKTFPIMVILIILTNVAVFVWHWFTGLNPEAIIFRFGAIPWEITHFREIPNLPAAHHTGYPGLITLFTSMFLHGGLLHLLGNMLYLWVFGDNVEAVTGHLRFPVFYILCGLVAAAAHIGMEPNSEIPMVGASGAISGVLGAYMVKFPKARIHLLFWFIIFIRVIRVPAVLALGLWFAFQVLSGMGKLGGGGGVAWFAHIGGFVAGAVLVFIFQKKR